MASLEELKAAVRDALDSRGVLDELRAAVRSEVFRTLDEGDVAKPKPDGDTWIINELIREYLAYHGLRHTLAVFHPGTFDQGTMQGTMRCVQAVVARAAGRVAQCMVVTDGWWWCGAWGWAEAGQPTDPIERPFIAQQVGLSDDDSSHRIPLLYGLLAASRRANQERR